MAKKEITRSKDDLALILSLRLKKCNVLVTNSEVDISVYPSFEEGKINRDSLIGATAVGFIIKFCELYSLSFYITTCGKYDSAKIVIY